MPIRALLLAATMLGSAPVAAAQEDRIDILERRLAEQQDRIDQLEAMVSRQAQMIEHRDGAGQANASETPAVTTPVSPNRTAQEQARADSAAAPERKLAVAGLDVGGDLRVRQEWNSVQGRNRSRTALRGRLRANYSVDDHFSVGAQLSTGDPDDPNTADVTLGSFVDDLAVSLDQAWIGYRNGGFAAYAGKFPQPFQRTDMVWDGDVSPQGIAATYGTNAGGIRADARGLYFIIDEAAVASVAVDAAHIEHWLLSDGRWAIRLDLHDGTLLGGPALVEYRMTGLGSARPKLDTLRKFVTLARKGRLPASMTPHERRAAQWILELRVADALIEGARQQAMARALFGHAIAAGRWRIESASYRLRVQRLVRVARRHLAAPLSGPWFD